MTETTDIATTDNTPQTPDEILQLAAAELGMNDTALAAVEEDMLELFEPNEYTGDAEVDVQWVRLVQANTQRDGIMVDEDARAGDLCVPMRTLYSMKTGTPFKGRIVFAFQTWNSYPALDSGDSIKRISPEFYDEFIPADQKVFRKGVRPTWGRAYNFIVYDEETNCLFRFEFAKTASGDGRNLSKALRNVRPNWLHCVTFKTKMKEGKGNKWFVLAASMLAQPASDEVNAKCALLNSLLAKQHAASIASYMAAAREGLSSIEIVDSGAPAPAASFQADDDVEDM